MMEKKPGSTGPKAAERTLCITPKLTRAIQARLKELGVPMTWQAWTRYAISVVWQEVERTGNPFPYERKETLPEKDI